MMDYVNLVQYIKSKYGYDDNKEQPNPQTPVYVFGGSYGGMLATWLRIKYPTHFHGAIASSAPILWFKGATDPALYTKIAGHAMNDTQIGPQCYGYQRQGFYSLIQAKEDDATWPQINTAFSVCPNSTLNSTERVEMLIESIADRLGTMAMVNYPYATNFVKSLPAWPVEQACINAASVKKPVKGARDFDYHSIERLAAMMKIWQGNDTCLNLVGGNQTGALDGSGWEVQTCYELPMPQGDDPFQSAYTWTNWYEDEWTAYCLKKYKMAP